MRHTLLLLIVAVATVARSEPPTAISQPVHTSTQYGTQRLDFQVDGHRGFVILPTAPADDGSKPWIWYAPTFIGRHPDRSHTWMFSQLLDNGFAIAGIDVGESYGSPDGRRAYCRFHAHVTGEYGLDVKASLLGQSRGGLMLYNWAVEHPENVRCIGGIYTVCNLTSYPGLARAHDAYNLTESELRAKLSEHNPIDRLAPLAKAKIPIFHVHGNADRVVPLEANAAALVNRYRELAGPAELLVVPGKGHQVCPEFFQCQPLLDFLLRQGCKNARMQDRTHARQ